MLNPPTNTHALQALLERLYPNTDISRTGVALLATQIDQLENRCEIVRDRIEHQPATKARGGTVGGRVLLLPHTINWEGKYGTNNHGK